MRSFSLSKKEMELMEIFWDAKESLARQEILERAAERKCSWKPSSVHILVNSLLAKGAVRVAGYSLDSHRLSRTFQAGISKKEYSVMQVRIALENARNLAELEPKKVLSGLLKEEKEAPEKWDMSKRAGKL